MLPGNQDRNAPTWSSCCSDWLLRWGVWSRRIWVFLCNQQTHETGCDFDIHYRKVKWPYITSSHIGRLNRTYHPPRYCCVGFFQENTRTKWICGFLIVTLAERDRIQSVIKKAQRYGYLPRNFHNFSSLVDALETNLFNAILYNPNHVLHQLMPSEKVNSHNLPERSHNLTIPLIVNNILRKKFLYRLLFRDMY